MKGIMITAPSSGSGKTTVTMGIIRALKRTGKQVACFKTGPDYIDTAFLKEASGLEAGNLDMHLQGQGGMKSAFSLAAGDLCVIEGAMGYFDGIYNTYQNSSYEISKVLDVNCVLVYTPKGEMFSAIPKIQGMAAFEGSKIKGIILNKVSRHYYTLLKEQIEKYTAVKVLGFVPHLKEIEIKSRHLGLVQSTEMQDIHRKIDKAARTIAETVDMNELMDLMTPMPRPIPHAPCPAKKHNITVAIAKDKAFSFYYRENLFMFERACNVVYFSPLYDRQLPPCDLVYLGGGYPEVFKEALSQNIGMLDAIKTFAEDGGCIYGECGGLMYLTAGIENYPMAGVFKGQSVMTEKLQRFGYIDIVLKEDCMLGQAGETLTAHEFHRSVSEVEGQAVFHIRKTMGSKTWACGYTYKNVLAGYPHINFLGNIKAFEHLLDYAERHGKR